MIANFLVELHVPQAMANKLKVSSLLVIILNNGKRIQWALRIKESVDYEGKMSHQWATRAKGVINGLPGQKESSMSYQGKRFQWAIRVKGFNGLPRVKGVNGLSR